MVVRKRIIGPLLVAILSTVASFMLFSKAEFLEDYSSIVRIFPRNNPKDEQIVLVLIDDSTLMKFGSY